MSNAAKKPRVVLPGGKGFLGLVLAAELMRAGYEVVVLTRSPARANVPGARIVGWDGETLGPWREELDGADAVVNLAGRNVNCRYHKENRRQIMDSRINSTRVLGEAVAAAARPPRVWLNSSTATIYRHALDRPMDEYTGELGVGFSIDVATAWEREFERAPSPSTRKVALRTAMVMGRGGGAFRYLHIHALLGLGGTSGPGNQYVSWIHEQDFVRAVRFLLRRDDIDGIVNVAAPVPLPMADFQRALRQASRRPFGIGAPAWLLEIAMFVLRSESELILKSRRVVPARLLEEGFTFRYPEAAAALEDLAQRRSPRADWFSRPGRKLRAATA